MKASYFFLLSLAAILTSHQAFAAKVFSVKNGVAYVKSEPNEMFEAGQLVQALSEGKVKGVLKIIQVKGDRFAAKILKGVAEANMAVILRPAKSQNQNASHSNRTKDAGVPSTFYIGGLAGYLMNSMNIALGTPINQDIAMKGTGFSLHALADAHVYGSLWFRALLGYQTFATASSDLLCGTSGTEKCKVNINYIGLGGWARYVFSGQTIKPWIGGGVQLLFPMSKSATAVASITSTNTFSGGGGVDWFLTPTTYIPIQAEYGIYPPGEDAKATYMGLRIGYAKTF